MLKVKCVVALFFAVFFVALLGIPVFGTTTELERFNGWLVTGNGGVYSESNGVITFSGDERAAGPALRREFWPKNDFEVSIDLKAETLGEVNRDPLGAGEGFGFGIYTNYVHPSHGVTFELRGRAGGQFLLVWHDDLCDRYGWDCNWEPFVYNGIGYNNGYAFWHPDPPQDRSNATIKPDVWYTLRLIVKREPFTVTGEVYTEEGILLGTMTIDCMNDFTFDEIRYFGMSSGHGGTFYIRNIEGITPTAQFNYAPAQVTALKDTIFNASESNPKEKIVSYAWDFGDGNKISSKEPTATHAFTEPGSYNVSLKVTDDEGQTGEDSQIVKVWTQTHITISTETQSNTLGTAINVKGRLYNQLENPISNEPITIYYTFPAAETWYPIGSAFTDETGEYNIQWMNIASGTFTLNASWNGNETFTPSNASTTLSSLPIIDQNVFFFESNSTVTALSFNSTTYELSFTVTGETGTTGYVKAAIDKTLIPNPENLKILLDGKQLNYTLTQIPQKYILAFTYTHSTHQIKIKIPQNQPTPTDNKQTPNTTPNQPTPEMKKEENLNKTINPIVIIVIICVIAIILSLGLILKRKKDS